MGGQELLAEPHRRYDPLRDEWVLVSAGRTSRPWQGRAEPGSQEAAPAYDPTCYLCPGNVRANGDHNPAYASTFVFENDFAALHPDSDDGRFEDGLLRAEGERGTCRVICFSPRHDLTMSRMTRGEVRHVIDLWAQQTAELGARYPWVQVFENRGPEMGASNPHPHGQIWAGTAIPREAAKEETTQRRYFDTNGRRLLLDYAAQEEGGPRVVEENDQWLVVVPFWATWPFETLLIAKQPVERVTELDEAQRDALADILIRSLGRYDALFGRPFPYSMGWHQAPFADGPKDHWQLHAHFYPPLLRATVRKFMVGYELLSETQRDITAEDAAERLRQAVPVEASTTT
jgi:UDPglucose--hexose-1-phosphate uridylyltransferase